MYDFGSNFTHCDLLFILIVQKVLKTIYLNDVVLGMPDIGIPVLSFILISMIWPQFIYFCDYRLFKLFNSIQPKTISVIPLPISGAFLLIILVHYIIQNAGMPHTFFKRSSWRVSGVVVQGIENVDLGQLDRLKRTDLLFHVNLDVLFSIVWIFNL